MFVRKRDPRYKAYIARQAQPPGQASPTPASGSVTPRKTAPKSTFVAQDWQKVAETSDAAADLEWARAEGAEDEEWECIACNKTFRSEAAWNGHERSKKHLRAVEQLKREMQDEEQELELRQSYDDELANVEVKVHQGDDEEGQGTAGANASVDSSGDKDLPEATPDRGTSTATPKEEENTTIEGKDLSSSRPGTEQQRTDKKTRTPSPPPLTPPPIPKSSQKERARTTRGSSPRQQVGGDPKFSEENSHHAGREDEDDEVPVEEGGGAEDSTKGEALSKREKRRAREAAKKARDNEAKKNVSAVSFLTLASFNSHALLSTLLPPHRAFVSRVELSPFGFFFYRDAFCCQLIISTNSATFAVRRLTAGQNCSNMSAAKAMHWQIHVIEIRQRKRERRRSSQGDMMDHFRTRGT
jgi:DnaJ homolog subfamily A member 5